MKGTGVGVRAEKEPERYGGIGGWGKIRWFVKFQRKAIWPGKFLPSIFL